MKYEEFEKVTLEVWNSLQDNLYLAEESDGISVDDIHTIEVVVVDVFRRLEEKLFTEVGGWAQKVV